MLSDSDTGFLCLGGIVLALDHSTEQREEASLFAGMGLRLPPLPHGFPAKGDFYLPPPAALQMAVGALDVFGIPMPPGIHRSAAEVQLLKENIALVARVFSKNYTMEVFPAPGGGWACGVGAQVERAVHEYLAGQRSTLDDLPEKDFRPTRIFYDLKDLVESPLPVVMGVLRHEVGHANHSDYRLFFKGQRLAIEEGYFPTSWMLTHNALEDPWVNNREIADSEAVRENMTQLYAAKLPEVVKKINSLPATHQLGLNINHYWVTGQNIPGLKDQKVLDAFAKIKPFVDQYFKGASAKENYDTLLKNIWPEIKKLEGQAIQEETLKELARRLSGSKLGARSNQASAGQGGVGPSRPGPSSPGGSASAEPQSSAEPEPIHSGSGPSGRQRSDRSRKASSASGPEQCEEVSGAESGLDGASVSPGKQSGPAEKQSFLRRVINKARRLLGLKSRAGSSQPANNRAKPEQGSRRTEDGREDSSETSSSQGSPEHSPTASRSANRPLSQPQPQEPDPALAAGMGKEARQDLTRELDRQQKEHEQFSRQLKQQQHREDLPQDVDLSQLPPDLRRELERVLGALAQEIREELDKEAREALDRKQAEEYEKKNPRGLKTTVDRTSGKRVSSLNAPPSESETEEIRDAINGFTQEQEAAGEAQAQREEQERERRVRQELQSLMEKRDMLKNGFGQEERQHYLRFKELEGAMGGMIANFMRVLAEHLPKKEELEHGGEFYTGSRLNHDSIVRRAPVKDYKIYQRREVVPSQEPRMFVQLLIDNSGSMSGQKMEESLKTAIFWARVLKEFNIPFSVKLFGERVVEIMRFEHDYDLPRHRIKPRLVQLADASGGSTNIGEPLEMAQAEMKLARRRYPDCFGAVFVISDSGANRGKVGADLKSLIETMQKESLVMNFILTQTQDEVNEARAYFGNKNVVAPASFKDLPAAAFRVLRVTMDRVLKLYSSNS